MPRAGLLRHQRALVRASDKKLNPSPSPTQLSTRVGSPQNALGFSGVPRFSVEGTHPRLMKPGTLTQVGWDPERLDRWQGGSRDPGQYDRTQAASSCQALWMTDQREGYDNLLLASASMQKLQETDESRMAKMPTLACESVDTKIAGLEARGPGWYHPATSECGIPVAQPVGRAASFGRPDTVPAESCRAPFSVPGSRQFVPAGSAGQTGSCDGNGPGQYKRGNGPSFVERAMSSHSQLRSPLAKSPTRGTNNLFSRRLGDNACGDKGFHEAVGGHSISPAHYDKKAFTTVLGDRLCKLKGWGTIEDGVASQKAMLKKRATLNKFTSTAKAEAVAKDLRGRGSPARRVRAGWRRITRHQPNPHAKKVRTHSPEGMSRRGIPGERSESRATSSSAFMSTSVESASSTTNTWIAIQRPREIK